MVKRKKLPMIPTVISIATLTGRILYYHSINIINYHIKYYVNDSILLSTQISSEDISSLKTGSKFLQSVKSRLTVAQVVDGVRNSAVLTFDFIMFVLLAG